MPLFQKTKRRFQVVSSGLFLSLLMHPAFPTPLAAGNGQVPSISHLHLGCTHTHAPLSPVPSAGPPGLGQGSGWELGVQHGLFSCWPPPARK